MKKFFLQHRTNLGLAIILLLVALILGARYGLLPFPHWTKGLVMGTPITVTAIPIGTTNRAVPIVGTGSIESPTSALVTSGFSGHISEIYVVEGQAVKAGQPLVKLLGSSEPSTSSETTAPANQNSGTDSQAQAAYDNALKEYTRDQKLYEKGAIPRRQAENSAARLQALQENLGSPSDASPQSSKSATTGSTTISAPIDGIVTGLSTAVDKGVQAGQKLMVLDSGEVQVAISIEQQDLYLVHPGTTATIEVSGQTLLGQVVSIYPELGTNNIPSFRTHIKVTNDTAGLLKIGMSVTAHIDTGKSATVFTIPPTAIFQDNGLNYIYIVDNGKALRQQITIGEPLGDLIEITATLPEQAMVITSNLSDIRDGDAIVITK